MAGMALVERLPGESAGCTASSRTQTGTGSNMVYIKKPVWIDSPAQPSGSGRITVAAIRVTNQQLLFFERGGESNQSLEMKVRDPYSLGLKSGEPIDLDEFVDRVLTACNLLLKEVRLSTVAADTSSADIVWDDGGNYVKDRFEFELCSHEELDETRVLEVLGMIHAVYDAEDPPVTIGNMRESLKSYSSGIVSQYRKEVFKSLYVALEKAVNFDNKDDKAKFEGKVRGLAGDQSLLISDFNWVNSRLKHSSSKGQLSRQPDDTGFFHLVMQWRPTTSAIVLRRLKEAVAGAET